MSNRPPIEKVTPRPRTPLASTSRTLAGGTPNSAVGTFGMAPRLCCNATAPVVVLIARLRKVHVRGICSHVSFNGRDVRCTIEKTVYRD